MVLLLGIDMPHRSRDARLEYERNFYRKRMRKATRRLGGKCVDCDTTENLEFHHIDPTTKLKKISALANGNGTRFWAEVHKCELVCKSCHNARHPGGHFK